MMILNRFARTTASVYAALALALAATGCPDPITATHPVHTVSGVTVTTEGNATNVVKGDSLQFSVGVAGENSPAQTITWSIVESGKHGDTNISPAGLLTVATGETLTSITVKVTSTADTSKSGTKTVDIAAPTLGPSPALSPSYRTAGLPSVHH